MAFKDPIKKKEYAARWRAAKKGRDIAATGHKNDCMNVKSQTTWNLTGDRKFLQALKGHRLYG